MRLLFIQNNRRQAYTNFLANLITAIFSKLNYDVVKPEKLSNAAVNFSPNSVIIYTKKQNYFFSKFTMQFRLAAFSKHHKIDAVFQPVSNWVSQKKTVQLLIADDISALPLKQKFTSKTSFITYSAFAKRVMIDKGFTQAIHIVPLYANAEFQPISWSQKQQVKMDYAEGKEYFLASQSFTKMEDALLLLKAFSGFKKWQHSGMKLVLTGKFLVPQDEWNEKFDAYKYRDDLVLFKKITQEQTIQFFAAAYAFIHLPKQDADLVDLLQAMQCHTPVITGETASIKEYAGNAVFAFDQDDFEDLAQKMILIYKDENLRGRLVKESALQAEDFIESGAAQALQAAIESCVQQ